MRVHNSGSECRRKNEQVRECIRCEEGVRAHFHVIENQCLIYEVRRLLTLSSRNTDGGIEKPVREHESLRGEDVMRQNESRSGQQRAYQDSVQYFCNPIINDIS